MMNRKRFSGLLGAALLLVVQSAIAQTTANLTGTVTSDNAPIPGVTVTISSPNLQGPRTAVTDATVTYTSPGLPPADPTRKSEVDGLQTTTPTGAGRQSCNSLSRPSQRCAC